MITVATPEAERERPEREHPVIAWIAVAAIVCACVLIAWARIEVHGTGDLEAALAEESDAHESPQGDRTGHEAQVDDAVTANRWASTFSP
jgi:hypothetical protein